MRSRPLLHPCLLLAAVLATACGGATPTEPSSTPTPTPTPAQVVYVAGYEYSGVYDPNAGQPHSVAIVWKNGIATPLTDGTENAAASSVAVSGGDVYVAGWEKPPIAGKGGLYNQIAKLWKNGVATPLAVQRTAYGNQLAQAFSVANSGSDVYVAGEDNGVAVVWKNGVETQLPQGERANSVAISGIDVYVAGWRWNGAALWKNGETQPLSLSEGADTTLANSVAISGNDVYLAGEETVYYDQAFGERAVVWKNGVPTWLTGITFKAAANSVAISGSDVYVAGQYYYNGNDVAAVWKNGVETRLTDGTRSAVATSVAVSGSDVYVAGCEGGVAILWKNGVAAPLTDGTRSAAASSVFVSPH